MAKIEYVISIQDQKAVSNGYALQNGHCYKVIQNSKGKFLGQLEVVLDDHDNIYKGIPSLWVDVSFISYEDIKTVLKWLKSNGFFGCPCIISQENRSDYRPDNKANDGDLCCFII